MRVTITGDARQIKAACRDIIKAIPMRATNSRGTRRLPKNQERYDRITAQRRVLRRAFDLIRHDPTRREIVSNLAKALGGSAPMTDAVLESAQQILRDHGEELP